MDPQTELGSNLISGIEKVRAPGLTNARPERGSSGPRADGRCDTRRARFTTRAMKIMELRPLPRLPIPARRRRGGDLRAIVPTPR
ncbi:hypothetical protein EVAR_84997_1 [Eumeta japonica]|uniref:Uncharacterized protein n=1 Tax=Eumeta variegata TaxID=151549 RepID=A0A4C1WB85_EUMVA|nr:hypothetical protein EVAR_84997_1 [Eumeta japonica]